MIRREGSRRLILATGAKCPPFLPDAYAELCRAAIIEVDIFPSGRIVPAPGDRYVIQVRRAESEGRRNYTACHEVGHLLFMEYGLFPQTPAAAADRARDGMIEEAVCEEMAAGLLMPWKAFVDVARAFRPSLNAVEEIARTFRASFEATLGRLATTRPWPFVSMVRWTPQGESWRGRVIALGDGCRRGRLGGLTVEDVNVRRVCEERVRRTDPLPRWKLP